MRRSLTVVVLLVASAIVASAVAMGATPPQITAERAAVLDPSTDTLLYHKPGAPSQAAMGSTAKIMTIHLALQAAKAGHVQLHDKLTISDKAASQACNCFGGEAGTVQGGDQMTLEDAVYATALSNGEPTVAVAEFVAKAVLDGSKDPNTTWEEAAAWEQSFIGLMNAEVAAIGLAGTQFQTPHGGDKDGQYTTAADLTRLWEHAAAANPTFLEILGWWNRKLLVFHGGGPVGTPYPASYSHGYYPGVEASKGGNSTDCEECWIASAGRLGRRLTVSNLQSSQNRKDAAEEFRYGFEKVFQPTPLAATAAGVITGHALACAGDDVVHAARTAAGTLALRRWTAGVKAGALQFLGGLFTNQLVEDLDIDRVNPAFVATIEQRPAGQSGGRGGGPADQPRIELRTWRWNGGIPTLADTAVVGNGSLVRVTRIGPSRVLTAHRTDTGARLRTWSVADAGLLQLLDTIDLDVAVTELDVAANTMGTAVMVAARTSKGSLVLRSFEVANATGHLTYVGEELRGAATSIRIAHVGTGWFGELTHTEAYGERYAVSYVGSTGRHGVAFVRTEGAPGTGVPIWTATWDDAGLPGNETAVTGVRQSGAASAYRGFDGRLHVALADFPWDRPVGTTRYLRVAHSLAKDTTTATDVEICGLHTTNPGGAQVTAGRSAAGELFLTLWREG